MMGVNQKKNLNSLEHCTQLPCSGFTIPEVLDIITLPKQRNLKDFWDICKAKLF